MRRRRRKWTRVVGAILASTSLHYFWIVPRVLAPLVEKPEAPLEIVVAPDPGAAEDSPLPPEQPQPPPDEEKKKEKAKVEPEAPAPEVAKVEEPKPVEAKPVETKPVQMPKPVEIPKQRMQMVDQNKFEDEAVNNEARFLAQKNHRVKEDTSARNTNLIREVESKNEASSEPNDNKDPQPGAKNDKIAELENKAGPDKTMPRSAPRQGEEGTATEQPKPGPLSMRDLTPRSEVKAVDGQKPREGLEMQEPGAGDLPMARIGRDAVRGKVAQDKAKGGVNFNRALDHHMYDSIEGYDTAEKERNAAARAEGSHKKGRYDKYLAKVQAMRSSIENFTLAVKPGNQAELGTRANPFAGYITSMHRQIHKLFAFGFLTDLDQRLGKGKSAYDDLTLWTKLEIVVNPDGTVDKVGIVRPSGVQGFDVAAIDSVMSAAPFEVPPKTIRSADGKVYLHWQFHRDEQACITAGVDPFILTTPGETPRDLDGAATNDKQLWQQARQATGREPPRQLKRSAHEDDAQAQVVRPTQAAPPVVPEVTQEVRAAAEGWFAAYTRGSVSWLAGWSATPFTAAGEVVARDPDKLKAVYKQLLGEAPAARTLTGFEVLTPAGIRGKLGGLPPGGEESNMLYAVGKAGSEEFILLLKKSDHGWRVCGVDR